MREVVYRHRFSDLVLDNGTFTVEWRRPKPNPTYRAILGLEIATLIAYVPLIITVGLPTAIAVLGAATALLLSRLRTIPPQLPSEESSVSPLSHADMIAEFSANEALAALSRVRKLASSS